MGSAPTVTVALGRECTRASTLDGNLPLKAAVHFAGAKHRQPRWQASGQLTRRFKVRVGTRPGIPGPSYRAATGAAPASHCGVATRTLPGPWPARPCRWQRQMLHTGQPLPARGERDIGGMRAPPGTASAGGAAWAGGPTPPLGAASTLSGTGRFCQAPRVPNANEREE